MSYLVPVTTGTAVNTSVISSGHEYGLCGHSGHGRGATARVTALCLEDWISSMLAVVQPAGLEVTFGWECVAADNTVAGALAVIGPADRSRCNCDTGLSVFARYELCWPTSGSTPVDGVGLQSALVGEGVRAHLQVAKAIAVMGTANGIIRAGSVHTFDSWWTITNFRRLGTTTS